MGKYQLFTKFVTDGWLEVEADTLDQAIHLAQQNTLYNLIDPEDHIPTVDLHNSYEWIGDFINDWRELDLSTASYSEPE